jgi:hypothetical protein
MLTFKEWDSRFFGKDFYVLKVDSLSDLGGVRKELAELDARGVFGVECQINIRNMDVIPHLEDMGFRLVDSRMEFITHTFRGEADIQAPVGDFRRYEDRDWDELAAITIENFVDNPNFKSRYTNPNLFSREESVRYYLQWHKWVLDVSPDLFLSWVDGEKYVGFYSILRLPDAERGIPNYKVGLLAIHADYRSHNGQNLMQAWLFRETSDTDWTTINSPQLTNTAGLKNNIRSGKEFKAAELFFFRKNPRLSGEGDS